MRRKWTPGWGGSICLKKTHTQTQLHGLYWTLSIIQSILDGLLNLTNYTGCTHVGIDSDRGFLFTLLLSIGKILTRGGKFMCLRAYLNVVRSLLWQSLSLTLSRERQCSLSCIMNNACTYDVNASWYIELYCCVHISKSLPRWFSREHNHFSIIFR